jgi:hypothetical protein
MENNQSLVEKWEQSGLLDGAVNKEGIANCLEDVAQFAMLQAATLKYRIVEEKKLGVAISLLFPVVRLALGERNFQWSKDENYTREVIEVEYPSVEDPNEVEPEDCSAVAKLVSEKFDKYKNLKIHGFFPEFPKEHQNKFEIHLLCSEDIQKAE